MINNQLKRLNDLKLDEFAKKLAKLKFDIGLKQEEDRILADNITAKKQDLIAMEQKTNDTEQGHILEVSKLKEEKRELNEDIDRKKDYLSSKQLIISGLEADEEFLNTKIKKLIDESKNILKEIKDNTKNLNELKQEYNHDISELKSKLEIINDELVNKIEELNNAKIELSKTLETIQKENLDFDIKKRDLDIYIKRFKKEYPNKIII